jgi:hypothetical protein
VQALMGSLFEECIPALLAELKVMVQNGRNGRALYDYWPIFERLAPRYRPLAVAASMYDKLAQGAFFHMVSSDQVVSLVRQGIYTRRD